MNYRLDVRPWRERSLELSSRFRCGAGALLALAVVGCASGRAPNSGADRTDPVAQVDPADPVARVRQILAEAPLVDGHVDLMIHFANQREKRLLPADSYDISGRTAGQVDLPRLRAGQVGAGIFTVGIEDENDRVAGITAAMDLLHAIAARNSANLEVVDGAEGLERAVAAKRIAVLPGLEGGDQIGGSLDVLRAVYDHGVRAMTLTWEHTNEIGDSNADAPRHDGLSPFGVDVVHEMNRLGMLVDLSHAADATAARALAETRAPVIFSHSGARALCPSPRNLPDDLLRAAAAKDGLVMVSFVSYYSSAANCDWYVRGEARWGELRVLRGADREAIRRDFAAWDAANPEPRATLADVADQVEYVRRIAGIDHVGIGADFDGMGEARTLGLEDAATYPALFAELARRGWTDAELRKLAGENFLRVLRAVEARRGTASAGS
ncbi:MAG: dipeptidase [Thermoanaerobaculia bacterium]